jgi:AcrR family transcriptional regulator
VPAGRPRSFSQEDALDRALELFWRNGYEGTSIADLTAAMGINRPSLYAAFGDKQALFRAAVDRYVEGPGSFVGRALSERKIGDAIRRLLFDAADELTMPGRPPGCLAVHGALSCGAEGAAAREVLAAQRAASQEVIRERLARAAREGDLPPGADPGQLARYLAALFQGMAVQAASGAEREDLIVVARMGLRACGID